MTAAADPASAPPATTAAPTAAPVNSAETAAAVEAVPAVGPLRRKGPRGLTSYMAATAFIGLHVACVGVFFVDFSWTCLALFLGFYSIRVFGLTAGYHRYFAHRGYKTSRWFQFVIGCMGASSLQRGPIWWAGHHRGHHKYSDTDLDPHSPITRSVFWSHVGWVLSNEYNDTPWDQMKDWQKYPEMKWLDRFDILPGIAVAVFCLAVGGWAGFFWGFVLGTVAVYHVTFMVNSVCHLFGRRRFATTDASRNNWLVALLTFGEGWHNNHHHYPSAARQGFRWWELDISYVTLKVLSWFGIVWELRQPTRRALAAKAIAGA